MNLGPELSRPRPARKHRGGKDQRRLARPPQPFPVFVAYSDVPAARHAIARLSRILQSDSEPRELQPMLWRFDQLDRPRWREMALREAARASTIVLAMSASATLTAGAEAWLTALTVQQRGATISTLLLVGDETWTISLQQTGVNPVQLGNAIVRARREPVSAAVQLPATRPETACAA